MLRKLILSFLKFVNEKIVDNWGAPGICTKTNNSSKDYITTNQTFFSQYILIKVELLSWYFMKYDF